MHRHIDFDTHLLLKLDRKNYYYLISQHILESLRNFGLTHYL